MKWLPQDVLSTPLLDNSPGIHHHNSVRETGEDCRVMRNQQQRDAMSSHDVVQEFKNLGLQL